MAYKKRNTRLFANRVFLFLNSIQTKDKKSNRGAKQYPNEPGISDELLIPEINVLGIDPVIHVIGIPQDFQRIE